MHIADFMRKIVAWLKWWIFRTWLLLFSKTFLWRHFRGKINQLLIFLQYIAALHVWVALIVPGCVHVCLHFAVGVGLSSVCMFHVLILMFILVLNCEVLWVLCFFKCYILLLYSMTWNFKNNLECLFFSYDSHYSRKYFQPEVCSNWSMFKDHCHVVVYLHRWRLMAMPVRCRQQRQQKWPAWHHLAC